jgi:hypothetical protein
LSPSIENAPRTIEGAAAFQVALRFVGQIRTSGQLQSGMTSLGGRAGALGGAMGALDPIGLTVAAAMGAAAIGVGLATQAAQQAVQSLSDLANMADRLGVTTEALQEFRFAAEQNGVAAANMDTAIQRFTGRLGEAQAGTGELLPVLEQYSIALRNADGTARSAEAVLRDYADAAASARDPQERLRLTVKAFDQEGAGLVKLLEQGSEGFAIYAQEARDAVIVIEDHLVQKAFEVG